MSERQRLTNSVPRGLLRFEFDGALTAKPINDDLQVNITGSLPPNFAYIVCSMSYQLQNDRAADFEANLRLRIFNGIPNGTNGNEQIAVFPMDAFTRFPDDPQRVMSYTRGPLRNWFPNPLYPKQTQAMSFTAQVANGNNTAAAAGTQLFHMAFYQYDLNQAIRFPLNSPIPVGIR